MGEPTWSPAWASPAVVDSHLWCQEWLHTCPEKLSRNRSGLLSTRTAVGQGDEDAQVENMLTSTSTTTLESHSACDTIDYIKFQKTYHYLMQKQSNNAHCGL